jgi:hypothetical protein
MSFVFFQRTEYYHSILVVDYNEFSYMQIFYKSISLTPVNIPPKDDGFRKGINK